MFVKDEEVENESEDRCVWVCACARVHKRVGEGEL